MVVGWVTTGAERPSLADRSTGAAKDIQTGERFTVLALEGWRTGRYVAVTVSEHMSSLNKHAVRHQPLFRFMDNYAKCPSLHGMLVSHVSSMGIFHLLRPAQRGI